MSRHRHAWWPRRDLSSPYVARYACACGAFGYVCGRRIAVAYYQKTSEPTLALRAGKEREHYRRQIDRRTP